MYSGKTLTFFALHLISFQGYRDLHQAYQNSGIAFLRCHFADKYCSSSPSSTLHVPQFEVDIYQKLTKHIYHFILGPAVILIFSFVLFKNQSRVIDRLGICRSGLLPALDSLAFLLRFHHSKISYLVARRGFTGCGQRISSLTAFCCHQNFIFENISGSYLKNIQSVPGNILHFNS